jgi:hypothetical protein
MTDAGLRVHSQLTTISCRTESPRTAIAARCPDDFRGSPACLFVSFPLAGLHFEPISVFLGVMDVFGTDVFPVVLGGGAAIFLMLRWIIAPEHARKIAQEPDLSSGQGQPLPVRVTLVSEKDEDSVRASFVDPIHNDLRAAGFGTASSLPSLQRGGSEHRQAISFQLNLYDLVGGVEFARRRLRELGAPPETCLQYFDENGHEVRYPISSRKH